MQSRCPCHLLLTNYGPCVLRMQLSADPGLCQGRGGAWDHRRCGTWLSGRKQRHTPSRQHLCQLHAPAIYMLLPNSYTYMPLPSGFQDVQDCRLPALKPPKRFRRPPRQQLLQLHAPAICFSGGSRLPFARPQTPQTLPQAFKATTLTATCPCHLFSGVQDCRLPALKPPKRCQPSRRPPRQQLLQLHAPAICFSGGSRLPFARPQSPQTLPTLPQASKATTLTATCPCHLFFRGFQTAVCPPSNPRNASAGLHGRQQLLQLHVPAICFSGGSRLQFARPQTPKRFQPSRMPSRQELLQLHAPAICFSGGSRLPFARPQTPQTLPQASKATTLTATCPCHLFFRRFKAAVCPPSIPPKRFQPSRRPPRQQLLQLHVPAICFSGGSRLQFARPHTPQTLPTLPQASKATILTATCPCHLFFRGFKTAVCLPSNPPNASAGLKATTLTATCPCHLFFRGFKTAVCPPSNPPNASAGLQGNNSYSHMPLPSVFQRVQDCRLPGLKPPKRFQPSRRPPRQQLLQLHAPAICFSGGSRLPFARPQTLQTLPQASKATTLTATCPCHLFFRRFKTAVCPPSIPPNASNPPAGLQGNNSYSYMSLPSVFQGVQDCSLPGLTPPKRFQPSRRPQASKATILTATCPCHLFFRGFKTAVCLPSNPPNASAGLKATTLTATCPAICFSGGSRLPFARPQTPQTLPTLPQASKATTLTATCPCHLFFRRFKTAVCPPSNPPNASAGLQGNNSYSYMPLPSVFQGVQDCRLPALNPPKRFQPSRRPPRQQLLQLHAPAICFSGGSRLPFARPQTPQTLPTLPQASKATTLTATCPCHLFFRGFKTAVCPASNPPNAANPPAGLQGNNSYSYMPLPSVFQGVQDCRLPALKPPKRFQPSRRPPSPPSNPPNASAGLQGNNSYSYMPLPSIFHGVQDCRLPGLKPPKRFQPSRRPPRRQLLQLHAPAICFSRGSRLPFARPQTPQTLPQAFKATTLTATCLCHLFFMGFKTAVCRASNPPNASAGLQGNNSYSYMPLPSFFQGVQDCRLPALKPPKRSRRPQGNNSYSYMPLPSVFQGVQDCRLPGLKPPKRFQPSRRPPRQQLLHLHAPAICFSGGSRLPFARPQTLQTLPQASKATTLTATCPCHLFFRGFKTAVCPPSNPPNASAGLQGNNSYSYMPLPSVFHRVQDCRLPAFKPPKRCQPSRRPPRQQLLQLHAPAICFSGGSRLPFARPHTLQTLPQGFKATTLTATCPCHLFFRQTAVCPPSNPRNASAGLQGNNSYSYMSLPSVFQEVQDCSLPGLKPPNASNPPAGLQGNNSYSYMPLPSLFQGVQDCRLTGLKPSKRFRRPPRQQLLQLHAPAICFSRGSRLPFARPQTPQTLPQASKATTLTATCPCHLFSGGSRLPFARPQSPQTLPTLPQASKATTLTATCPCHLFFRGSRLPFARPQTPKRFRRPPRQQRLQLHAPAICFSGGSRLPFARPQTPQTLPTLPQASKATTLTATCPCHLFFRGSRLPFARPQTLQTLLQASKATTLTATCPCHLFFRGFKTAVCPPSNPPNAPAGLQGNNSYSYMPLPSVFQGVQDCRLPALKPPKRFRRPPRQQLLQLHAPAICFSGGSRLPFARPQTLQTLPQASKATTLTATCPCHLFFRRFKTAVCPPSIPPIASNPPAGLQGNNSYSYMSLPSVF